MTRRRLLAILIPVGIILLIAVIAMGSIAARYTVQALPRLVFYNGVLIHVRNDTNFTVQLQCEYTDSPRIEPGQTELASFEPYLANSGCGVIRTSDHRTLGCVTVNPHGTGVKAGSTISLSTHLNPKMRCYSEF
jgi:hypothetical protein